MLYNSFITQQLTSAEPLMLYKQLHLLFPLALFCIFPILTEKKRSRTQGLMYAASNRCAASVGTTVKWWAM